MITYTADGLFDDLMLDCMPSMAACIDFGIDRNNNLLSEYKAKIVTGEITKEQLRSAAGDGKKLTLLLGVKVVTAYDEMK